MSSSSLMWAKKLITLPIVLRRVYSWLWKLACQNKRKFFFWFVLKDWLSTRSLLRWGSIHLSDYNGVFCMLSTEEDLLHLLFHCPFCPGLQVQLKYFSLNTDDILFIVESIKDKINQPFFMKIIITMCWAIWIMRNDIIFKNISHSV